MKRILSSIVVAILLTLPVSAFCVSLGNYVELNNATEISNVTELRNVQDLGGLESETIAFVERVLADGGTVEDVEFLNSFIVDAKANNYFSDIVAAYSPSWGVKGTTTASKLYSITGAAFDIDQPLGASQPVINLADLTGKTRLLFDGIDDSLDSVAFTFQQPETIILGGVEQETWTPNDRMFDGILAGSGTLYQASSSPNIRSFAGSVSPENPDLAVATPGNVRVLLNGVSSAIQVDNNAETTGSAGASDMGGFMLGGSAGGQFANISDGISLLLSSAVDGSYVAKMTAIDNFLNSAYGTP